MRRAFTLIEIMMAVVILALIASSVLVVMNRCITSTIDSRTKMQAFEIIRENMENLLASDTVKDMVDFGVSEKYPDIEWQTVVETFYEPLTSRMWIQGICSANYTDSNGEKQTVELTHWLTDLTKEQLKQILEQQQREQDYLDSLGEVSEDQILALAEKTGISIDQARDILQTVDFEDQIEKLRELRPDLSDNKILTILDSLDSSDYQGVSESQILALAKKAGISKERARAVLDSPDPKAALNKIDPTLDPDEFDKILKPKEPKSKPASNWDENTFYGYTEEEYNNMTFGEIVNIWMKHRDE